MKILLNLTPHVVNVYKENKKILTIESHGSLRLIESEDIKGSFKNIPLIQGDFKDVGIIIEKLPKILEGKETIVIVSLPVLLEFKRNRSLIEKAKKLLMHRGLKPIMFVSPHTGEKYVVRNDRGQIIGTKAFKTI